MEHCRKERPTIWWHIQCYHYTTRTVRDSNGHTRTERTRVNTHSARKNYKFRWARDISGERYKEW